jgi:hypothetical protein
MVDEQPSQLKFLQFHLPSLLPGNYTLAVEQTLKTPGRPAISKDNVFNAQLDFTVAGERLLLAPTHIQAVFPPEGSLLDHANILPHLVLTRSTAPWERLANPADPESPWLALLLLEDGEAFTQSTVKLSDLAARLPHFAPEPGEDPNATATLLELPWQGMAVQSLPTLAELKLLCHVRQSKYAAGNDGPEQAVVVGNRLPAKGVRSTVHLVSLEGRYPNGKTFDAGSGPTVALVSLKSWSFACLRTYLLKQPALDQLKSGYSTFKADFDKLAPLVEVEVTGQSAFLDRAGQLLGREVPADYRPALLAAAELRQTFRELVHALHVGTLCLPAHGGASDLLGAGFMPLPHQFRDGQPLVSWYHGPLTPATAPAGAASLPVRAADALLRYHVGTGLLDVSYAAAWKLGRLLGLSSKTFSVALYNWKRTVAQQQLLQGKAVHTSPLAAAAPTAAAPAATEILAPPTVTNWFADASLLVDVPFGYLVPDERLLPAESIRFFQVDALWMATLLDGAASLGRVIGQDVEHEQQFAHTFQFPYLATGLSGVLIRSELVAGWPDLVVLGYSDAKGQNPLPLRRRATLSKNVLLCLFEGDLQALDVQLKPEALHSTTQLPTKAPSQSCYARPTATPKASLPLTQYLGATKASGC